ncbi:PVC-type heme-binding CxxCH protein [Roseimaritima ulvae]|uniref:HEAT repeat protein n=1 Tax=Roseimaritima ulvae TaxID=980254 RepID=A0A5B9QUN0_9BACT|nr:PVC-type heme-binding CxxCH protein [Roseimaritima ulvae]QEG41652.1 HEAT repeat protein [Roseimaritima ulvae]
MQTTFARDLLLAVTVVALLPIAVSSQDVDNLGISKPAPLQVPPGFTVERVAGPPLVTHPTMGCFDDQGRLYVCNNAGVNLSSTELEQTLPNTIVRLVDRDGDGTFDDSTVFADRMTFPMGGTWHDGSLHVASPPNIWRLTDSNDDGVAEQREIIVGQFGYTGNAASIHGCFSGPDGRLYWTDGYHGHEFKDEAGNVTSKREGSYLFSCRPDGSDPQIHCGGGMDNPVELDFTEAGDMLGTVNILYTRPRVDCLVHWLHGGAYPHRQKVLDEIKITGDLLEPAHEFGHVAISGLTRYRSATLDSGWRDDWFATFFNSGKVVRLSVQPKDSTYEVTQHNFLSSTSREFHPTDVLEDADGSLLVIDTGGWFYRGCPTSQFAKPELLGGIYRIRRSGAPAVVDPRGQQLDWQAATAEQFVARYDDKRFAVRQKAIDASAKRGAEMLDALQRQLHNGTPRTRTNGVWTLTRLAQHEQHAAAATAVLQGMLKDPDATVRQATCFGLGRSRAAVDAASLSRLLNDDHAAVRRQAATALGMQRAGEALPDLIAALQRDSIDRSEQHAIVYALIEIGDAAGLRRAMPELTDASSAGQQAAWRGAVMALDQIDGADLKFDELVAGFSVDSKACQQTAVRIAEKHPQWQTKIVALLAAWFQRNKLDERFVNGPLLASYIGHPNIAPRAAAWLRPAAGAEKSLLILKAISAAGKTTPHPAWTEPLLQLLDSNDELMVRETIAAITSLDGELWTQALKTIFLDANRSLTVRMDAVAAMVRRGAPLDADVFTGLIQVYEASGSPSISSRAAQVLGTAKLSSPQLQRVAALLSHASPTDLRAMLQSFHGQVEPDTAEVFFTSLGSADALLHLSDGEFSDAIRSFSAETAERGQVILERLRQHQQQKLQRLQSLRDRLETGDAQRGQQLFASDKAKCSSCHRIGEQGKRVGPDLSTIGANRSAIDLLESIVFPSASIVRDYGTYTVLTVDGQVLSGLLTAESKDTLQFQQASGETVALRREEIEEISPKAVSLMPAGLDEALSEAELLDIVRYLQTQR